MNTAQAFMMGEINRGKELMVFDWLKAAEIIKKSGVKEASAGLSGDWEYTGGEIFANGKPVDEKDTYTFLSSTWATPELEVDGEIIECYMMQLEMLDLHERGIIAGLWGAETYWPQEALDILNGEED